MAVDLFQQDPDVGDLFVVNGIDPVKLWDGFSDDFQLAGMSPPTQAVTIGSSGIGQIVGTYFAYERWVDIQGNVSNLSPISSTSGYVASGATGTITNVTATTPIVVTSAAHGLATGAWVKISGVGGIDTANNTWQITVINANSFSLVNSNSDGISTYTGGGTWISGVSTINYTNVQAPTDPKVVRRQILRNTDGEATVFYVDVDTDDLLATSFSSTKIDSILQAGTSVPLLDSDGNVFANANGVPPNTFKCIMQQLDRMFLAGLLEYNIGSVSVTFGSTTVIGAGTTWKQGLVGRFLYIDGARRSYEIASVDETNQTLTLLSAYADDTDLFAFYSIKPPPAFRRIVQFSLAGFPQSWLATNGISVQETGDELTGLFQMGAFLYISERAHLHKLTFQNSPLIDGAVFQAANRGAVNQRCIVTVDSQAYMLDELGIHRFSGGAQVETLSDNIQALFRSDKDDIDFKINWRWKEFFHANLDRQRETIRWFVPLDGNRYPKHALCYQYKQNRWWLEKLPMCVGGTCIGYMNGRPQVFYGGEFGKVFAAWDEPTDIAPVTSATRSTVTSADSFSLTDQLVTFPVDVLNAPVAIVSGTGKGQERRIVDVNGNTLWVSTPWNILPDDTSVYQIGGVSWEYRSAWMRLGPHESMADGRFELLFEPMPNAVEARLRFFSDFSGVPDVQGATQDSDQGGGVAANAGDGTLLIDLTKSTGLVDHRLPEHREYYTRGKRYVQIDLEGVSSIDQIRLYQFLYEGAVGSE